MQDTDGIYKAWWCAGVAGDFIGYGESDSINSQFEIISSNFFANRSNGQLEAEISFKTFDGIHACDPSVIKISDKYYLYYGGLANHTEKKTIDDRQIRITDYPQANSIATTHIGVAISNDGINWQRQNNGNPILKPKADPTNINSYASHKSIYGAGQPSAVYLNDKYYLVYHDSTGKGSNSMNGAGIYALSSSDPLFKNNVSELRCRGDEQQKIAAGSCTEAYWKSLEAHEQPSTKYAIAEAFSPALAYSDSIKGFVLATHHQKGESKLAFFNSQFESITQKLNMPGGYWRDGPGLLTNAQGHIIDNKSSIFTCQSFDINIFSGNSTTEEAKSWDIARWGGTVNNCGSSIWSNLNLYIFVSLILIIPFLTFCLRLLKDRRNRS